MLFSFVILCVSSGCFIEPSHIEFVNQQFAACASVCLLACLPYLCRRCGLVFYSDEWLSACTCLYCVCFCSLHIPLLQRPAFGFVFVLARVSQVVIIQTEYFRWCQLPDLYLLFWLFPSSRTSSSPVELQAHRPHHNGRWQDQRERSGRRQWCWQIAAHKFTTTPLLVCCFLSFMNVSVFHEMCQFLFHDSFVCVFPLFSILSRWDSESQKGDVCYDAHFRSYMSDFVFDRWFYCTCIYSWISMNCV